jgi:hypothetical protein
MKPGDLLRFTLLGDGSSDRVLLPILSWLIRDIAGSTPLEPQWADLGPLVPTERTLPKRVRKALSDYPCHILFVHRDAEREEAAESRVVEIHQACEGLQDQIPGLMTVCVIPVRMTEAWLLVDESAIRRAAGNPQGRKPLNLPSLQQMERIHAKDVLHKALRDASELTGRKAKKLEVLRAVHIVADFIADYRQLDYLPSFSRLRDELVTALGSLGLGNPD